MNYWQIGIGNGQVDMVDIFLKLKVALIGPGDIGDYFDNQQAYLELTDGYLVKRFAEEVQIGDVFVLKHVVNPKKSTWKIYAVGKVVSPYRYEPVFDKVDNCKWDVQHCRRVLWHVPDDEIIVTLGGAPVRIQNLEKENPMCLAAKRLLKEKDDLK